MATKPSEHLDWGGVSITPTSGKKAAGWAAGERPARGLLNWQMQTADAWLKHLEIKSRWRFPSDWSGEAGVVGSGSGEVATGWTGHAEVDFTIGSQDAVQGPGPFPSLLIQCNDSAAGNRGTVYPRYSSGQMLIEDPDDTVFVLDAYVLDDGGDIDIFLGLHGDPDTSSAPDDGAAQRFAMFSAESSDTNWQCEAGDGTAKTANDSGVAPSRDSATWQRLEMQYHGSATPVGVANGSATVIFKINGTVVATITGTNVPTTADGALTPFFFVQADTTVSGSGDFWVGPCEIIAKHKDYE